MARVVHPKLTGEEFEALLAEHGWSLDAELIDGEAVVIPPDGPRAASAQLELSIALRAWQRHTGDGGLLLPSVFVKINDESRLGPDLAWWSRERRTPLPTGQMVSIPDWVCEVLSASTRENDLGPKRAAYFAAGVRELWFVDPRERSVSIVDDEGNERDGGVYAESDVLSCFGVETASLFPF